MVVSRRILVGGHGSNPKQACSPGTFADRQRGPPTAIPFLTLSCNYKILRIFSVLAIDNPGARGLYLERMEGGSLRGLPTTRLSVRGSSVGEASARQTSHCPQASKDAVWGVTRNSRVKGFSNVAEVLRISHGARC